MAKIFKSSSKLGLALGSFDLTIIVLMMFWIWPQTRVLDFQDIKAQYHSSEAFLLDRHGEIIQSERIEKNRRSLEWLSLDKISHELVPIVVSIEDNRFWNHDGIDYASILSSLWSGIHLRKMRGTSTLSMQTAALLDSSLGQGGQRSWWQKLKQMRAAWNLETQWTKSQILETYLNLITWREEYQGLSGVSEALFRQSPSGLNRSQCYFLAALLAEPQAGLSQVEYRACRLARIHGEMNLCGDLQHLRNDLGLMRLRRQGGIAPHVAMQLLHRPGESLRSTLDGSLQRFVNQSLQARLVELRGHRVEDAAAIVIDNKTGEILAYVASSGGLSQSEYVDGIRARRQAGSTLKPFLYSLAFERGLIDPGTLIEDSPLQIPTELGSYQPQNYDHLFQGWVSARRALASSMNIPTLKVLDLVSVDAFYQRLQNLGFHLQESGEFYGPALGLGSAEVSLWDLTNAYRCLIRLGQCQEATLLPKTVNPSHPVIDSGAAYQVLDILSDAGARAWGFGLDNPLNTSFWTAVKTGTSKGMRDNWCIGVSQNYSVGVWAGNFSGESMGDVSGVSGSAPLWRDIMRFLHQKERSREPEAPQNMKKIPIHFAKGEEQDRSEWIKNNQKYIPELRSSEDKSILISPKNGEWIALDPEISPTHQQVILRRRGPLDLHMVLDGMDLGSEKSIPWFPTAGKHLLYISDAHWRVLDSAHFGVKGLKMLTSRK